MVATGGCFERRLGDINGETKGYWVGRLQMLSRLLWLQVLGHVLADTLAGKFTENCRRCKGMNVTTSQPYQECPI